MRIDRRIPLFFLLAAAGCGSSPASSPADPGPRLEEGWYSLQIASSLEDSCWPADEGWPPLVTTAVEIELPEDAFRILPPPVMQWLIPPLEGQLASGNVAAIGGATVPYDAACSLRTTATFEGAVATDNVFTGELAVTFDGDVLADNGSPSDCSAHAGTVIGFTVPFPVLSNPANGSCAVRVSVDGSFTNDAE